MKRRYPNSQAWAALSGVCFLLIANASAGFGAGNAPAALVDSPCIAPDNGTGTVDLPPNTCDYTSPVEVFFIIDGLPPGTTVELTAILTDFVCPLGDCGEPGGGLGGEREVFESTLLFQLRGTGELADFRRTLRVPTLEETHSGPRTPGDPVQSFPADFFALQGNLPPGDPDFGSLQITAGTSFGLPSPGQTTLTDLGDGRFMVDSFFDITYRIDFVGAPGGALEGLSGSTMGTVRMGAIERQPPSIEVDNGEGTATLPPLHSRYLGLTDDVALIDGLPPGTTIEMEPALRDFVCVPPGVCGQPGGGLGGEQEEFSAVLDLNLSGTGALAGFHRLLSLPAMVETQSAARLPGAPVQPFRTDMTSLKVSLVGDPDFAQLVITAGTSHGLPSPGYTTLTSRDDGTYMIDSFFDISYRIDFVGAPGSVLDGLSGTTHGGISLTAFHDPDARPYRVWLPRAEQ
ncbi:MAG TPA: hypothetical protein VLY63_24435 [Anaerolineae bacterium]|nr:hypothetical protein [Anaerolineae bacterium]